MRWIYYESDESHTHAPLSSSFASQSMSVRNVDEHIDKRTDRETDRRFNTDL